MQLSLSGWSRIVVGVALACACGEPRRQAPPAAPAPAIAASGAPAAPSATDAVTLTVIGTNDLHGALDRLPIFAGYVANLRAARNADGGGLVLLDGGDMFQGTLESNLTEGKAVIAAYNAIGYTAVTMGNHELDFGPPGDPVTARAGEDPRGALKQRATEARFPILVGNVLDEATGARVDWPNMPASTRVDVAGVSVGIIGVSTESTPWTTMPANFTGLRMAPPAEVIVAEAARLRAAGAQVILVTGHIGTKCTDFSDPSDASSCESDEELVTLLHALPPGTIDVFVGGHTHAPVAHRIAGVAVIESYSNGRAFGRVDLRMDRTGGGRVRITGVKIYPPQLLCPLAPDGNPPPVAACHPQAYEGAPVTPSADIAALLAPYGEAAKSRREQPIGVAFADPIWKRYDSESPEGNLFADMMLAAQPRAEVALINGGGLRADLPPGPLTYGRLYEAYPFENRFALVTMKASDLASIIASNLGKSGGILSLGGATAVARCKGGALTIELFDRKRRRIPARRSIVVATSDFMVSGGEAMFGKLGLPAGATRITEISIRDAIGEALRARGGSVRAADIYDPRAPRLVYPTPRPVTCSAPPTP
jgi:2',3'-cyclic-nucleotide 2'-phosphodiesterase (5'-nucleotidase family)